MTSAPDGTWLASAGNDATVRIWDPRAGRLLHTLTGHTQRVVALVAEPDGAWLASAGRDATVRIWDLRTGGLRHTMTGHAGGVTALAVAPDGTQLASAGADATVRVWDPAGGHRRAALRVGHPLRSAVWVDRTRVVVAGERGLYFLRVAGTAERSRAGPRSGGRGVRRVPAARAKC